MLNSLAMPTFDSQQTFFDLLARAWEARNSFHQNPNTDSYRIFHGYSEGFPGITIDRYASCVIINKKTELNVSDDALVRKLNSFFPFESIVMKTHQKVDAAKGSRVHYLYGEAHAAPLKAREHGDFYFADPDSLHSNGLFLDARPARQWLKQNSESRRIYNMFAHTGSLGLAAKLGGAREVVHIDKSREATNKISLSYEFNKLNLGSRDIITGDIYFHLPRAIKGGQKFSGIILDPPPKVPVPPKASKHRPIGQDFETLIDLCCKLLEAGGWLLCIYHDLRKNHQDYDQEIIKASGHRLRPIWRARADSDFFEQDPERSTRMSAFIG